jgi:hypothetical protein
METQSSSASSGRPWLWPVVLVMALHLLTTAGTWWITDHGEILAVANRFLTTGRMSLENPGPGFEQWTRIAAARHTTDTRFLPLSILSLTPLLALDHLAGWREPSAFRFVYLQGHLFVGLGLFLMGRRVWSLTRSAPTTALAILLLGLNWPVWMIARRLGPEPVLFALIAAIATGGVVRGLWCQFLLPWVHASGSLLGLGALLAVVAGERSLRGRASRYAMLGWIVGGASVALLWNLPGHGHVLLGGYDAFASDPFFVMRNPLVGLLSVIGPFAMWTLPLVAVAMREGRRAATVTLALFVPFVAFLSLFSNPEPERRLAPLLAAWSLALVPGTSRLRSEPAVALGLLSLASGVIGLSRDFVDVVATPVGLYSGPFLLFLRLAFLDGKPALAACLVAVLLIVIVRAGARTARMITES